VTGAEAEQDESRSTTRAIMRWVLAAFFAAAGIAHLRIPETLLLITPAWVPFAREVIIATGVFEIAASIALLSRTRLRWWAGVALALYALCVWPANVKHAMEGIEMPLIGNSWWYHAPRLALQPMIIWACLFCAGATDWPWRGTRSAR
jgi:uncharacterized membrane protein